MSGRWGAHIFSRCTGLPGLPSGSWFYYRWFPPPTTSSLSGRESTASRKSGGGGPSSSRGGENAMPKLSETPSEKSAARSTGSEAASSALLSPEFSLEQRRSLLSVAHSAILHACESGNFSYAKTGQKTHLSFLQPPISLQLSDMRGVFTTLYLDHALRGCVGYALPVVPLYQAV